MPDRRRCSLPISRTVLLLLLAGRAHAATQAPPPPVDQPTVNIPFEHYTLPNGLNVILSVNHSIPEAAVVVSYHVGSKNEVPGRTGFAHLFEHVMFTGSGHVPYGMHDQLTEGVGGNNNGFTSQDATTYFENVPSNYIESALWMESDRMGFLLDRLDEAKFVAQRDIVQNERRQGVENQPYGRAFEIIFASTLPTANPYSWPVVGYMQDLTQATITDVQQFFRLYYAPSNATLSVVGDFDLAQVKAQIATYFGDLPSSAPIARPVVPPVTLEAERRLVYEDRVQVPRVYLAWPSVGQTSPDYYALEVLSRVLSGPRTAPLTKVLVYEDQSAASVEAFNFTTELAGEFIVTITPRPGHTLDQLVATTDSTLEAFTRTGPTADELRRAVTALQFESVAILEANLYRALILNFGDIFYGNPAHYQEENAQLAAVTAEQVRAVARRYLGPGRLVLSMVPQGEPGVTGSSRVQVTADGGHYAVEAP